MYLSITLFIYLLIDRSLVHTLKIKICQIRVTLHLSIYQSLTNFILVEKGGEDLLGGLEASRPDGHPRVLRRRKHCKR